MARQTRLAVLFRMLYPVTPTAKETLTVPPDDKTLLPQPPVGDLNMLLLIYVYGIALFFSISIHIGVLLNIFDFTPKLEISLKCLFGVLSVLVLFISYKKRGEIGKDNFVKVFKAAIPEWIKTWMGYFFLYGIGMFLFSLGEAFSIASATNNTEASVGKFNVGLTALIMTGFTLAFCMIVVHKQIEDKFSDGYSG